MLFENPPSAWKETAAGASAAAAAAAAPVAPREEGTRPCLFPFLRIPPLFSPFFVEAPLCGRGRGAEFHKTPFRNLDPWATFCALLQ